jgi:hypothetical protein
MKKANQEIWLTRSMNENAGGEITESDLFEEGEHTCSLGTTQDGTRAAWKSKRVTREQH